MEDGGCPHAPAGVNLTWVRTSPRVRLRALRGRPEAN